MPGEGTISKLKYLSERQRCIPLMDKKEVVKKLGV